MAKAMKLFTKISRQINLSMKMTSPSKIAVAIANGAAKRLYEKDWLCQTNPGGLLAVQKVNSEELLNAMLKLMKLELLSSYEI